MAQFQYATKTGQLSDPFEAADPNAALKLISGFQDVAPKSGVIAYTPPAPAPSPTITPSTSSDGAVSSTDVPTGQASGKATDSAAAAIGQPPMPDWAKTIITQNDQRLASGANALKLSFDAALASNNQQYASLFQELNGQHKNASEAGAALAAQLNPYSDPRISSTTGGYLQSIDQKYQAQAQKLQQQMSAAQQQLQAGFYEGYTKLVNDAQKENQKFVMDMQNYQLEVQQTIQQQANADRSFALQSTGQASDDFRSFLSTLSGSPQLQADIGTYQSSGKISAGLMPIVEKGMQAGMSPDEAISIFSYQSDSVRKQEALEEYRANQLILAQQRAEAAADRQTSAQLSIATTNAVLAAQSDMRARGISPGSPEWATGVASATGASPRGLSAAQSSKYTQMGVLANQLTSIKSSIDALDAGNPLWNTLQTYAGRDVSSLTDPQLATLNARLTSLSGIIGKTFFGEAGNLSNTDIQRVLNALPTGAGTAELRQALYAGLLGVAKDNAILTLESDAQAGFRVAPYVDSVLRVVKSADSVISSTGTKSSGASFTSPSGRTYNLPVY